MIAAIYCRKSTDQNIADEEKSVTRQVERARAYAARKGWTVDDAHVYTDDGISGAEFLKRPGFVALMNALRPRPAFNVLVVMDQSRLGRSFDEVPYALKRITDAGVKVWCYLSDAEISRETALDKFMVSAIAFVDDMQREQARERTRDALRRKAERGHVAGGLVYGYRNVRGDGHVSREIVPAEAVILRRIFREIAQGRGFLKIAQGLNAEGIPAPRSGAAWAGSSIRAMVFRELYRGRPVWGQTRWADVKGTKRKVRVRDRGAWVSRPAPELQIVDDALWDAAHGRLSDTRAVYLRQTGGAAGGRPTNPLESRYLLTGLLRCQHCGGGLQVSRQTGRRGEGLWIYYVCARQRTRGLACAGALRVPMATLDGAIVEELRARVLTPARITAAVRLAVEKLAADAPSGAARRNTLKRELRAVEQELGRYAEAIATAGPLPAILEALHARERRRGALLGELGELDAIERTAAVIDEVAVSKELRALCEQWQALLREDPPVAHALIRRLVPDRLAVARTPAGIRITGMATFGPLMADVVMRGAMVPPGGTDRTTGVPFAAIWRPAA